jgi:hypothetical protein
MAQPKRFETLVLGSGEGGKYLAWHMAKSGQCTAVIERKLTVQYVRSARRAVRSRLSAKLPISSAINGQGSQ